MGDINFKSCLNFPSTYFGHIYKVKKYILKKIIHTPQFLDFCIFSLNSSEIHSICSTWLSNLRRFSFDLICLSFQNGRE